MILNVTEHNKELKTQLLPVLLSNDLTTAPIQGMNFSPTEISTRVAGRNHSKTGPSETWSLKSRLTWRALVQISTTQLNEFFHPVWRAGIKFLRKCLHESNPPIPLLHEDKFNLG